MTARWAVFVALVIINACACNPSENHDTNGPIPPISLDSFIDGQWVLTVDRVWDGVSGNIIFPSDPLSEDDYQPAPQVSTYRVVLSDQGRTVSVATTPFVGARTAASGERVFFDLSQGTVAGGRFVVWAGAETLQGELTLYGSGRPIVQSERGSLVPTPSNQAPETKPEEDTL